MVEEDGEGKICSGLEEEGGRKWTWEREGIAKEGKMAFDFFFSFFFSFLKKGDD